MPTVMRIPSFFNIWKGSKIGLIGILVGVLIGLRIPRIEAQPVSSGGESPPPAVETAADTTEQFVSIDFKDVDIDLFIKFISELTGKNFVVDHRVRGKVTIISPSKISVEEAYKVFESVLEVYGFSAVTSGEVTKIVSQREARTKSLETRLGKTGASEDKIVTQIIPLKYAEPQEIKKLFAPLVSKNSVIMAYEETNTLIITDIYSNIQRLLKILDVIDVADIGQEISVIPLEYSDATKMVALLKSFFTSQVPKKGKLSGSMIQFVADERTNTVIVLASEIETRRIKKLVAMLDKQIPRGKEKIRVYYLEHANAEDTAKTLESLQSKGGGNTTMGKKEAPIVSEEVKITADKATNSLIIMADKEDYQVLLETIKKLDIPRAMVYIESLIMEVNVDKDFRLGTEWTAGDAINDDGLYFGGFGGGASGGDTGYLNTPNTGAVLPPGFSMGVFDNSVEIGGVEFYGISAVVQAYKKDKDVHILSTPQILTTNNEEAKITVGKNIPYQTRTSTTDNDTYNSFEYKDVGKTLVITPQISKDRMVRLNISLEVSDLESMNDNRPTTLKRTIDTTVIVKDSSTVVIGGLIDDTFSKTEYKVPCLGATPGLKWLFSSVGDSNAKTNLYIFLTPRVIKHPAESDQLYRKKKKHIEDIKEGVIKMHRGNS
jgi:general secretion pathway protein D